MLRRIVADKLKEVEKLKMVRPLSGFAAEIVPSAFKLSDAVRKTSWALIAECKLASPAKGRLCDRYSVVELAQIYASGGASALSVHTSRHFMGERGDLAKVKAVTALPVLQKDFIVDSYQIYEARYLGADAVLLIAGILSDGQLADYCRLAEDLGMDILLEVHTLEELRQVLPLEPKLLGINNRDLKTFKTDISNTLRLLSYCPPSAVVISESGIGSARDAGILRDAGVKGILVGEGLVTAEDISAKARELAFLD